MLTDSSAKSSPSLEGVRHLLTQLLNELGKIPVEKVTDGATIDGELRMESVAFVELQVAIEDYYNIEIDPIEVVERGEFAAIASYIYSRITDGK